MNKFAIFTDVSLNPKLKLGIGTHLTIPMSYLDVPKQNIEKYKIEKQLLMKKFKNTSSTKLELQTILWALETHQKSSHSSDLNVYTDSQCVEGLLRRRVKLEKHEFKCKKNNNNILNNILLYQKFYNFHDELKFNIIKVTGHSPSYSKNTVQYIFSIVDKVARKALRLWMKDLDSNKKQTL